MTKCVLSPGSFVIERYEYVSPKGAEGVQWCVHRVDDAGVLRHMRTFDTRRKAGEYVGWNQQFVEAKCCAGVGGE